MKKYHYRLQQSLTNLSRCGGFTLIELAMVLIILSFMLAMFLGPLGVQREVSARTETAVLLEQAREALLGYAIVNRHLPCSDADNPPNGLESRNSATGGCTSEHGTLPWATLGIKGVDAWGRYLTYRVDSTFSDNVNLFVIDDAEGASGIDVETAATGGSNLTSTNSMPAAIVFSHGANGHGAWTNAGIQLAAPTGADELENTDGNIKYVSHTPTPENGTNPFDDMLIWISPKVLINRMITAGRLP